MTAAVAVMAATTPPSSLPKRHGFSIESLIGKPDSPPSPRLPPPQLQHHQHHQQQQFSTATSLVAMTRSTIASTTPPPRPLPIKPLPKDFTKDDKHREREREIEREALSNRDSVREEMLREREIIRNSREKESRIREREIDILREREARDREMAIESMREREKELRDIRELKERAELARERELQQRRECIDGRNCTTSFPVKNSPRSNSPQSPLLEKSVSPTESENRLNVWGGEEFKHLLGGFPGGHLDSNGMYQPLRVCNRTLASINGMGGSPAAAGPLGMSIAPQFAHLPMNPFFPRELPPHHTHPLLAARYPGFMHHRYPMGPPPGLLFHPYRKPKRNRTAFSPNQLLQLEQAFEKNHYVVGQERKSLAAKLQLTETQVKVWFQNRRTKHKRMKAEEDGGSSGSHPDGHSGDSVRGDDGSDLMTYMDHEEDEHCTSDDEDEELSVTEDS